MLIEATPLFAKPGIRHAFFTREGGRSDGIYASLNGGLGSGDERVKVTENRALMARHLGVSEDRFLSLHQIHSPTVAVIETPWAHDDRPRADAMATREPGMALAIATADCGPVLFADAENGVIGAAHAGWRGALAGVLDATVDAMVALGARRAGIAAVLGPTIRQPNYEVGPEFVEAFLANGAAYRRFFTDGEGDRAHFDLPGFIGARLAALDIGSFTDLERCTYAEEDMFYSYRRATHRKEPDYGRLISAIALEA